MLQSPPTPTHDMSHKPTCQRMSPSNSQTTIIHMSITCCFMCSCAPTDHMLGGAHTFWSTFNTYDPNSTLVIQLQYLWFMMWCNKQTHGVVRTSGFGIKDVHVAKIIFLLMLMELWPVNGFWGLNCNWRVEQAAAMNRMPTLVCGTPASISI